MIPRSFFPTPSSLLGTVLGLGLLGAGLAGARRQEGGDVLEVRELRIVDEAGRAVLVAGVDAEGNGFLELANGGGTPVVFLGSASGHGALDLVNAGGQRIVFAGANVDGDGGVRTDNADGTRAFYLGDDVRGNARVSEASLPGARVTH